jgi:hypothetical protein
MNTKAIFTTLVGILVSASAFGAYQEISASDLGKYKKAAEFAGLKSNLSDCQGPGGFCRTPKKAF